MTKAWKFSIDFLSCPELNKEDVRDMVTESAYEADGDVFMVGDNVYMVKRDDAFAFRLRAGHLVGGISKAVVAQDLYRRFQ
jgi:hypothetical protein